MEFVFDGKEVHLKKAKTYDENKFAVIYTIFIKLNEKIKINKSTKNLPNNFSIKLFV